MSPHDCNAIIRNLPDAALGLPLDEDGDPTAPPYLARKAGAWRVWCPVRRVFGIELGATINDSYATLLDVAADW